MEPSSEHPGVVSDLWDVTMATNVENENVPCDIVYPYPNILMSNVSGRNMKQ